MASRNAGFKVTSMSPLGIIVAGSFQGNAAASPVASTRQGQGFTVSRVSAGLYRIALGSSVTPAGTFSSVDRYNALIAGVATVQSTAAAVDRIVTVGTVNLTNGTVDFEVKTAAVLTDLATTDRLNFVLVFTNSAAVPQRG